MIPVLEDSLLAKRWSEGVLSIENSLGPKIAGLGYPVVYGSREPSRTSVRVLVQ